MKTVFLDIDTQIDFMYPAGALYVPGAEHILATIARLNRSAVDRAHSLLSTADAHAENDPEFHTYPAHCVKGTIGQGKPSSTLVGQPIVEKQTTNCFFHTSLSSKLDSIGATRYVVYGVVTEICVKFAVFGLLDRGGKVELVRDAIQSLDTAAADQVLREFTERGGIVIDAAQALSYG